jgi:hypothetical protein
MTPPQQAYNPTMFPRIAFVTTCKGRLAHLRETLKHNIADNADYDNCVFVVLGYGDPELDEYMESHYEWERAIGKVAYYRYPAGVGFSVSHAKNLAMRAGMLEGADILVTVDADNFTGTGFARFLGFEMGMGEPGVFLCPHHVAIKEIPHGPFRPLRGYAGRLAIRTQDFIKLGGYDETFDTWRGEDIDLVQRMLRIGFRMKFIPNCFLPVIPHGSDVRFKEYQHAKVFERAYEFKVIQNMTTTVVNYGTFGCGTVYRNFDPLPIAIGLMPTRIFGIGFHKTGTTSLHHAFSALGIDSWHWKSNRQAWRIFREMTDLGRSNLLEESYALCDNPIPLLYEKLDRAYPGSKFILTMLSEEKWLDAVQCLWDPKRNPYYDWDKQPFSNRIHSALYGRTSFDRPTFLDRYHRHNRDVCAYFSNRPQDLLVMNMNEGAGWKELCGFLGKPIPSIPYPHAHKDQPANNYWAARHTLHQGDL